MESLLYLAGMGVAMGSAIAIAKAVMHQRDAERRDVERERYTLRQQQERRSRAQASIAELVDRFFPFVKDAWRASEGDCLPQERLRRVLAEADGVPLGRATVGYDAILPTSSRRQALACLGKTGYGKTTVALHLIRDDLVHGRGLCILGSEAELFRDWVLPLVPAARGQDVIFFKPSDPRCTLTWNLLSLEEGENQALAAGELFAIFKRAVGESSIGARADAILSSAFGALVGRDGATLATLIRFFEDEEYRTSLLGGLDDPYLKNFWTKTFPEYPAGASLPLAHRLHQFLRLPQLRAALCHPYSSFSIRDALEHSRILLIDLSGLDPDSIRVLGQAALSKFQIELMRRERIPEEERTPMHVYVDEFHVFAGSAEGTWRELLARGRRYGLGLHLFTQHPHQLPKSLQREVFGNVSSLIALNLSAADASSVRREFLVPVGDDTKPIPAEEFVSLPVGTGFARLGSGAQALKVKFLPPIPRPDSAHGARVREVSWKHYAAPPAPSGGCLPEPGKGSAQAPAADEGEPPTLPTAGRGGSKHKLIQDLVRKWAEASGFRATLEQDILGGSGRVDVALTRGMTTVGVEIAITNTPSQVAAAVTKCLAADFGHILVVAPDAEALAQAEKRTSQDLVASDRTKVHYLLPDGVQGYLKGLPDDSDAGTRTAGYRIHTLRAELPEDVLDDRRQSVARLVGIAVLRAGGRS